MVILAVVFMVLGAFFLLVATIGTVRLPDVYSRSHAVSLTDSMGAFFMLLGLAIYHGFSTNLLRILLVLVILFLLNPVIGHSVVRAAHRAGLKPWTRKKP